MLEVPDNTIQMLRWAVIENVATLAATTAIVLGLYWMGAGLWALTGLLLLANLNSLKFKVAHA